MIHAPPLPTASASNDDEPVRPSRTTWYKEHQGDLPERLRHAITPDDHRRFHQRSGRAHLFIAARHAALHVALTVALVTFEQPFIWIPLAALQGINILGFIILLHDVIHGVAFHRRRKRLVRVLGLLYAAPSAISASQFERWHMDHHRGLGSPDEDPKRHHLSPKRNARWLKLLYLTPALFLIYARAAGGEARNYDPALRRRIVLERVANATLHATLVTVLAVAFGGDAVLRAWFVPLFGFFPIAFMVNRIGQHYWVDPTDPAKWSTRVDGSPLLRFLFLNSNHHIEHHYFPAVPLQHLPELNRRLRPFWAEIGLESRSYSRLLWKWFVENRAAHTDWSSSRRG
jgi:fatty acid desaturase